MKLKNKILSLIQQERSTEKVLLRYQHTTMGLLSEKKKV